MDTEFRCDDGTGGGEVSIANYTCTVTDTVSHATATSNVAIYKWTNTGP